MKKISQSLGILTDMFTEPIGELSPFLGGWMLTMLLNKMKLPIAFKSLGMRSAIGEDYSFNFLMRSACLPFH